MNKYQDLWVQKYSPQKLSDIVLTEENRNFFNQISDSTPHLLLYGNAGTGKTTLAKVLVKDVLKCQYLYINASDENGVDTIRNKVISFSQTILNEGMQSKEITERKFISDKYADAQWLNLLFITNFWVNDHSINFEKSDEAIEKSVNLAFDLMGQTALDSMLNFGKFLFQNR
jgi:DNA polymerase III delta prime subunit